MNQAERARMLGHAASHRNLNGCFGDLLLIL